MKYIVYSIVILIIFNGCNAHIITIDNKNNPIIKYYSEAIEYSTKWAEYRLPYRFYNETPNSFNFEDAVNQCKGPSDSTTKVYYHNQKAYENMIPYKSISYCNNPIISSSIKKYDGEGKIIEHSSKMLSIKYSYTKQERVVKWYDKKTRKTFIYRYIYDKNKKLLKILFFKQNGKKTIYLFNKKNSNILNEYTLNGKLTGDFLMIDEFLDE